MHDHYVAVDWARSNMAIAHMTRHSDEIAVVDVPSSVKELKVYLGKFKGKITLTFEEMSGSQWLYTELREHVDELIVCDPCRNHLLKEGPKTDKIDAKKMVQLLRAGLLKPVFHTGDSLIEIRKIVSGYDSVVKTGVRFKSQLSALLASLGKTEEVELRDHGPARFVLEGLEKGIAFYENEKSRYEEQFKKFGQQHKIIRLLKSIPGIGPINAVKIVARVVDPRRFPTKNHFLSYCGLIRLEKISGGKSYGWKQPRYCRMLKGVFKMAAISVLRDGADNPMRSYYDHLIQEKRYSDRAARTAVARRIAVLALGVFKTEQRFDPYRWRKSCKAS